MADVIQTSSGPGQSGPSALAIVLAIVLIVVLLFLGWWVFFSEGGPIRSNSSTNVNIEQKGGSGGSSSGSGGSGGSSNTSTSP